MDLQTSHTTPIISVVIVNYNVKDFLVQCLSSLMASLQGIPSEIIVVDNNSTDGSVEYARERYPQVQYICLETNIGFGRANNKGFAIALEHGAEYILCLNPDTLVSEDTMSIMLQYMNEHQEVGLGGCKLLNADGTFQLSCRRGFPTPWASFTKIFGLQWLFPRSPLFARYNQTFRSENETYYVDAVAGAFMIIRRATLQKIKGFDEDFFMYGEDLDICYRVVQAGWKVAYIHSTSVIHYKGESTRRSNINEVRVFYEAMVIFATKHFGTSRLLLVFLRIGIFFREFIAHLSYYRRELLLALIDLATLNGALLLSTKLWKGRWLAFPDYAYPGIFIVISGLVLLLLLLSGEYSPYKKPSFRAAFTGLMASFFVLSTLPYFIKEIAFSRAVLVLTITMSVIIMVLIRLAIELFERARQVQAERRILFIGANDATIKLIERIREARPGEFQPFRKPLIVGVAITQSEIVGDKEMVPGVMVVGEISYLKKIIEQWQVNEVIITDTTVTRATMIHHIKHAAEMKASRRAIFRFAREYDEVIAGSIVERFIDNTPALNRYALAQWQLRWIKRLTDIIGSLFLLTIALPVVYLTVRNFKSSIKNLIKVLRGSKSLIGLYPLDEYATIPGNIGLVGLTGLAHIHTPEQLSTQAIRNINEFYMQHYSPWLDLEILVTLFFKKRQIRTE